MRPGAGEARVARVTIAVRAVFGVRSIQAAMAPLHRQRTLSINICVSECVRLRDAHTLHMDMAGLSLWYATTFRVTFLSVTHHVRTYVLCENRSSIQSLALMRSAIITVKETRFLELSMSINVVNTFSIYNKLSRRLCRSPVDVRIALV